MGRRIFLEGVLIATGAALLGCNASVDPPSAEDGSSGPTDDAGARDGGTTRDAEGGNGAPVWLAIPAIRFVQGIPSRFSLEGFVSDPDGDALVIALNDVALPAGVTFDAATSTLVYDGSGPAASTEGHVLSADDGVTS